MSKYIVGIDPSKNGTGVVIFETSDDYLNVINTFYMAFTQVKKEESPNIKLSRKKDYEFAENKVFNDVKEIISFIKSKTVNSDTIVAIEDYAYGATGNTFDIGEFVGHLKINLLQNDYQLRLYEPSVIKKFATGKGNSDKVSMGDAFIKAHSLLPHILMLTENLEDYQSPKADLVDAFWIADLNLNERRLRVGSKKLSDYNEKQIEVFNAVSNKQKINILSRPYLKKE